jgi:hypothetical protein
MGGVPHRHVQHASAIAKVIKRITTYILLSAAMYKACHPIIQAHQHTSHSQHDQKSQLQLSLSHTRRRAKHSHPIIPYTHRNPGKSATEHRPTPSFSLLHSSAGFVPSSRPTPGQHAPLDLRTGRPRSMMLAERASRLVPARVWVWWVLTLMERRTSVCAVGWKECECARERCACVLVPLTRS